MFALLIIIAITSIVQLVTMYHESFRPVMVVARNVVHTSVGTAIITQYTDGSSISSFVFA